jgi:hypothetical protein
MVTTGKELSSYIHFYMGCPIWDRVNKTIYTVDYDFMHARYDEEEDVFYNDLKLILRPLSAMTENEAIEVAKIIWGQPDSVKWRAELKKGYWDVKRKHHSKSITIDTDMGEVTYYEDNELADTHKHHFVTLWMLKQGFDLFDLHAAGLCVYENEVTK